MSVYTPAELNTHLKQVLMTAGEVGSMADIGVLIGPTSEQIDLLLNDDSCYSLLLVKNLINGNHTILFDLNGGWVVGTDTGKVTSQYRLDIVDGGDVDSSYIKLMTQRTIVDEGTHTGYQWKQLTYDPCYALSTYEDPVFGKSMRMFYQAPFNLDYIANRNRRFLSTMTLYHNAINTSLHSLLDFEGTWFKSNVATAFDFYGGMTYAQVIDPASYELVALEHNAFPGTQPQPVINDFTRLELWRGFEKRKNSTKKPATTGEIIDVRLVHETSVTQPSFELNRQYLDYNYCKWGGRYYFINDVVSVSKDIIRINCDIDDGATRKTEITSGSAYIDRMTASTDHIIIDEMNPPTDEVVIKHTKSDYAICAVDNGNYWITTTSLNGLQLFQLTPAQFETFSDALWNTSQTTPENIKLVMENIISVKRVPFDGGGTNHNFDVGNFYMTAPPSGTVPTPITVKKLDFVTAQYLDAGDIDIPFASADWGYNSETYLDHTPYCTAMIYLPFVGLVPLDLDGFGTLRKVRVKAQIDRMACGITYKIMDDGDGRTLATYCGNFGTSIPISANTYDQRGFITSELTTLGGAAAIVGGIATGNFKVAATGLAGLAGGAMQMNKAAEFHTQINGGMSSNLGFYVWDGFVHVITVTKKPVNTDLDHNKTLYGNPYKKVGSLNVNGYVKTVGAQINMAGTQLEKERVNALLDSGIYIE